MPDQDKIKATANVLEAMVAEVSTTKPQRGTRLTPVGAEKLIASIPVVEALPRTPQSFPNDQPQEVVEGVVAELQRQIGHLQEVVAALLSLTGRDPLLTTPPPDPKAAEAVADAAHLARVAAGKEPAVDKVEADFATEFAAKQAAAQAATFKAAPAVADGWVCPEHGGFVDTTSPRGREFRRCDQHPACKQFEK